MLRSELPHPETSSDDELFAAYRAWIKTQLADPNLSPGQRRRMEGLDRWRSQIVDSARLIRQRHRNLLYQLKRHSVTLEPTALGTIIQEYQHFHPDQQGRLFIHDQKRLPHNAPKIAVALIGVSGAGKDAVLERTIEHYPGLIAIITTGTARPSRGPNELYKPSTNELLRTAQRDHELVEGIKQGDHLYGTPITAFVRAYLRPEPIKLWRGDIVGFDRFEAYCAKWGIPTVGIGVCPAITMDELEVRLGEKGRTEQWRREKPGLELMMMPKKLDVMLSNLPADTLGVSLEEAENMAAEALGHFLQSLVNHPEATGNDSSFFGQSALPLFAGQ